MNPSDIPRHQAQCAADLRSISASGGLPADIQRERIELLAELLDNWAVREAQIREAIESGIFTALVAETAGVDDEEWHMAYVWPRVQKWTNEIMADKIEQKKKS